MPADPILALEPLSFPWQTADPFLFCVHHDDDYPQGNDALGPKASLDGRQLGQDFAGLDGWRMYHGETVPGFPAHPHRGFETVTIVRRGLIDHSDSLGATARFGAGDVQWLTAGRGIVHAEMFPLVERERGNPLELFQIWLNLPARSKMAAPHFSMLWSEDLPRRAFTDAQGRRTEVVNVAGRATGLPALAPPPESWAADPASDVSIATIAMAPHATWTLAPTAAGTRRRLYFFRGAKLVVAGQEVRRGHMVEVRADAPCTLVNGDEAADVLLLQGRPIGEPVAQYGPFVMNTPAEIHQAFADYRATQFGGWPFGRPDPVHPRERGRFARHVDGRIEDRAASAAAD
ncbi:MAG: pirin family protein [Burkholderiales bacterium]